MKKQISRILGFLLCLAAMMSVLAVSASAKPVECHKYAAVSVNGNGFVYDSDADPKLKTGKVEVKEPEMPKFDDLKVEQPQVPTVTAPDTTDAKTKADSKLADLKKDLKAKKDEDTHKDITFQDIRTPFEKLQDSLKDTASSLNLNK